MRSGNAYLHGMKSITKGSLAYIATQVCRKMDKLSFPLLTVHLGSVFIEFVICIFMYRHGYGL
jgi:hypothetical protein